MSDAADEAPLERLPVSIITGFLGSGKTTLLRHLLQQPELADTAVLINEFGEIGLDHLLVEAVSEDAVLLSSGCLCCTVRGDLVDSLRRLFKRRVRGEGPPFRRVVIETTGLADPAPILHTLMSDPLLADRFRLDGVIATVDAVNGMDQLDRQVESVKQAAVADRIVLSKADLASEAAVATLRHRLRVLNPAAPIFPTRNGEIAPGRLFDAGLYNPASKSLDVQRWLKDEAYAPAGHDQHDHDGHEHRHAPNVNRHDDHIRAFCLTYDRPLDWPAFVRWMEMMIALHGADILRVKGLLNVAGTREPLVVHGVQHLFHPPVTLEAWPSADRRSRLVFITRDLDEALFRESLEAFQAGSAA